MWIGFEVLEALPFFDTNYICYALGGLAGLYVGGEEPEVDQENSGWSNEARTGTFCLPLEVDNDDDLKSQPIQNPNCFNN